MSHWVRFGGFELDLETADLRSNGRSARLPEQQFQILRMLLESNGNLVSRDEIRRQLWPNNTVVEFDQSINAAIMKLRTALGDTADKPRFIETLARRGYRFLVAAEFDRAPQSKAAVLPVQPGLLIGTKVLHYRILNVLGGGGMGLVFRGEDLHLNRPVALKFLPVEAADDALALQRFEREARTASSLNHPNICTIYQVEEHNGQPFIVMELLEGETLRAMIAREAEGVGDQSSRGLAIEMVLKLAIQIAEGLEAAHQKDIMHRDIKPANIFITTRGHVKILDFGLAKVNAPGNSVSEAASPGASPQNDAVSVSNGSVDLALTRFGDTMGTVGYMSPEQIRGEILDCRTDIFSYGLILYEMITGRRAFGGDTPAETQAAILNTTPVPIQMLNPSAPVELVRITGKCLKKPRDLRYNHASEIRDDLLGLNREGDSQRVLSSRSAPSVPRNPIPESQAPPISNNPRRARPRWGSRRPFLTAGTLFLIAIAALLAWTLAPAPAPRVLRTDRLTRSGRAHWTQRVLSDGVRLFFAQRIGGRQVLAFVPIGGGDPVLIPTSFSDNISLLDISPDHTKLLLSADDRPGKETTFWIVPVAGGSPQRLGALAGNDAAWFPDGRKVLFVRGSDIYTANEDGGEPRRVSTVNGWPKGFHWSPDGRVLRFSVENAGTQAGSIWEAAPDGTQPHPWTAIHTPPKPGWMQGESGGVWTPDGMYFIYRSMRDTTVGLWAVREPSGLRGRFNNEPFLLQTFPLGTAFLNPLVSPDGKRIYFAAEQETRELMRYEAHPQRFLTDLDGIPARMVDFSRDGKWVAYYSYDYHLWRSRVDGSDRLQLTFAPLAAGPPRWSPDGTHIAFRADQGPTSFRIYLISPNGGTPQAITPPEFTRASAPIWSPDGKSLIFGEMPPDPYTVRHPEPSMQRVDLKTGQISALPGSEGLNAQDISPDGQNIVAFMQNDSRLVLFNLASHRITELAQGKSFYAAFWSRDGKYVYFQDLYGGAEQSISRVRLSDRKVESVAGLSQFNPADAMAFSFAGLAPDNSPLASVILNRGDIYSLNVDFP